MNSPTTIRTPAGPELSPSHAARPAPARKGWTEPRYLACVGLLAAFIAVLLMIPAPARKLGLPLKQPLYLLDKTKLGPEYELSPVQPEPFSHETIDTLGTEEYLSWNIIARHAARDSAAAVANVFVTYYTGQPDMVPHVPQDCMSASGFQLKRESADHVTVRGVAAPQDQVPLAVCEFTPPQGARSASGERTVMYFFLCNGEYQTDRYGVRLAQSKNLTGRYAYYAKIELTFMDESGRRSAKRDEAVAAAGPLLQKLLPALLAGHFQDWAAIQRGAAPVVGLK